MAVYESYQSLDAASEQVHGDNWRSQTFTPNTAHIITFFTARVRRVGSPGIITAALKATDVDSKPTGADLATGTLQGDDFSESFRTESWNLSAYALVSGTKYVIILRKSGGDTNNRIDWARGAASPGYAGGEFVTSTDAGVSWTVTTNDQIFEEGGSEGAGGASPEPLYLGQIDWNNNGSFADANEDISCNINSARWLRGREAEIGATPGGTLELVVRDSCGNYVPESTSSIFGSTNVTVGRQIAFAAISCGVTYSIFRGTLEKIIPHVGNEQRTAYLLATDGFAQFAKVQISLPEGTTSTGGATSSNSPWRSVRIGGTTGIMNAILDAANWSTSRRLIDTGTDILDTWWANGKSALAAMNELEIHERSRIYINSSGTFVYENRIHRSLDGCGGSTDHQLAQGSTFVNAATEIEYEFSARSVRNAVAIATHARGIPEGYPSTSVLWNVREAFAIDGLNTTTILLATLTTLPRRITVPRRVVDWRANTSTDNLGTDFTTSVQIWGTLIGQQARLRWINNSTQVGSITLGDATDTDNTGMIAPIRGLAMVNNVFVTRKSDSDSITKFGERTYEADLSYTLSRVEASTYADWVLARFKDPHADFVRFTIVNESQARLVDILDRDISDRVRFTIGRLGITGKDYFINALENRVDRNGLYQARWFLSDSTYERT